MSDTRRPCRRAPPHGYQPQASTHTAGTGVSGEVRRRRTSPRSAPSGSLKIMEGSGRSSTAKTLSPDSGGSPSCARRAAISAWSQMAKPHYASAALCQGVSVIVRVWRERYSGRNKRRRLDRARSYGERDVLLPDRIGAGRSQAEVRRDLIGHLKSRTLALRSPKPP